MSVRRDRLRSLSGLLIALVLVAGPIALLAPPARGASPAVSGTVVGPTTVGEGLKENYTVNATGGPAEAANGTTIGTYAYTANLTGPNTTGASINPSTGVLVNNSVTLELTAPSLVETITISVVVTSSLSGNNQSGTLTLSVSVIEPYRLNATLVAASGETVGPFLLDVTLDGTFVGTISVPTMTGGSSYPIGFAYVNPSLSPGWHTFAISLSSQHGQVTFPGGAQQYETSFYVNGPPPDYTPWYLAGLFAFVAVIFIWSARVGARRRGKAKK